MFSIRPHDEKVCPSAALLASVLHTHFRRDEQTGCLYASFERSDGKRSQSFLLVVREADQAENRSLCLYPLNPSGSGLFGYETEPSPWCCRTFGLAHDESHPGEVLLDLPGMLHLQKAYQQTGRFSRAQARAYAKALNEWMTITAAPRASAAAEAAPSKHAVCEKEEVGKHKKPFSYSDGICPRCKKIFISRRAYLSIIAEALSRSPDETGGVLLGQIRNGIWYLVEATDPGLNTVHTVSHSEMDDRYYNHLFPVLSRLYKNGLRLIGMWHRHPGSLDRFSHDDNCTNASFAKAVGSGTLSFLVNFDPRERLTCYYLDAEGDGTYYKVPFQVGDEAFRSTDFLELNSVPELWKNQSRLQQDVKAFNHI